MFEMIKGRPVEERSNVCLHMFKEFDNIGTWLIHNSEWKAQVEVLADLVGLKWSAPMLNSGCSKTTGKDKIVTYMRNT